MVGFPGFPEGKLGLTNIPDLFFSDLLPHIEELAELKVTLYAFWALSRMEGSVRFLRLSDFIADKIFMKGMAAEDSAALKAVEVGIELAVARGTFLMVTADSRDGRIELFFLNTEKGRALVDGINRGQWQPDLETNQPVSLIINRPNIFVLYEQNIGTLTPMIADELRDAEKTYPHSWLDEAIRLAVENNVRKWSYVSSILERWRQEGKRDGISRRDSGKELERQVPEEYQDIVKH
jgi:DnaD/phage-associated family protein